MLDQQLKINLPAPLQIVSNPEELYAVRELRKNQYAKTYPSIDVHNDIYDVPALILYSINPQGQLQSSARLVKDSEQGLPEDPYFPSAVMEYREQGLCLMELGRFIIQGGDRQLLKTYYRAFYDAAIQLDVDVILMAMKPKDVALHKRIMGAKLLSPNMGITYGGQYELSCVAWEIAKTNTRFFEWIWSIK